MAPLYMSVCSSSSYTSPVHECSRGHDGFRILHQCGQERWMRCDMEHLIHFIIECCRDGVSVSRLGMIQGEPSVEVSREVRRQFGQQQSGDYRVILLLVSLPSLSSLLSSLLPSLLPSFIWIEALLLLLLIHIIISAISCSQYLDPLPHGDMKRWFNLKLMERLLLISTYNWESFKELRYSWGAANL